MRLKGEEVRGRDKRREGKALITSYNQARNSNGTTIDHLRAPTLTNFHTNTHILNHTTITDKNTYEAIFYLGL